MSQVAGQMTDYTLTQTNSLPVVHHQEVETAELEGRTIVVIEKQGNDCACLIVLIALAVLFFPVGMPLLAMYFIAKCLCPRPETRVAVIRDQAIRGVQPNHGQQPSQEAGSEPAATLDVSSAQGQTEQTTGNIDH